MTYCGGYCTNHWADGSPGTVLGRAGQGSSGVLNLPAIVPLCSSGLGTVCPHRCPSVLLCECADELKLIYVLGEVTWKD